MACSVSTSTAVMRRKPETWGRSAGGDVIRQRNPLAEVGNRCFERRRVRRVEIEPNEFGVGRDRQARQPDVNGGAYLGTVTFFYSRAEKLVDARCFHIGHPKSDRIP